MAENSAPVRRGPGKPFAKGVSGNPGGRPKALVELRELARGQTRRAVEVLTDALDDEDARVRVAAAHELLDRGWGKATQPIAGEDGEPLRVSIAINGIVRRDGNREGVEPATDGGEVPRE